MKRTWAIAVMVALAASWSWAQGMPQDGGHAIVRFGADVLFDDGAAILQGKRVGLVTNHTGVGSDGVSTILKLHEAEGVQLAALFAPEHGIAGAMDEKLPNEVHEATGLTVYSLYGPTMKPTAEMLEGLDVLIYDMQDIGARFYTYITTLSLCMEAAGESGIDVVVLDRPNPIAGVKIEGPVLETELKTFVGPHEIALRHGMTVGELALMFRDEFGIACNLTVVPAQAWRRAQHYDDTDLPWRPTSPAMPSVDSGLCYPGVCLLEPTNVSVGRGTPIPFQQFGAPWIDGEAIAARLSAAGLPGVAFEAVRFTPARGARHYGGEECGGVRLHITDRESFEPVRTGLHIVCAIQALHGEEFRIPRRGFDRLCGLSAIREAIEAGKPAEEIEPLLGTGMDEFAAQRGKYLLYE